MTPRTLLDVVRLSTGYLEQHGSTSPRLDAELLAAHALHLRRIDLYLQHDRPLGDAELSVVRELVRRRAGGEPVAYLTGYREFYGRSFSVGSAVLVPRPETETVVERALQQLRSRAAPRVADLGTGSGCIAVTLALEVPDATVDAVDVSDAALTVASENIRRHAVEERVRLHRGSWASAIDGPIDVLVANPPYVTTGELAQAARDVRDFEPAGALDAGVDGLEPYRALLDSARGKMAPRGAVVLEVDPRRADAVLALTTGAFETSSAATHRDIAGRERVVEVTLR